MSNSWNIADIEFVVGGGGGGGGGWWWLRPVLVLSLSLKLNKNFSIW